MNNEIKEILENIQYAIDEDDYWEVTKETLKPLLDYITNLQQENERLKDIVIEKDSQIKEMIIQKTDYTAVNILEMKLEDYKSRCEKAIEILQNLNDALPLDLILNEIEHSENILQNGSDDNE